MSRSLPPWSDPAPPMPGRAPARASSNGSRRSAIPRRPDLVGPDARPLADWRWWEAVLVYVGALVVAAFVAVPVLLVIRQRADAEIGGNIVIAVVVLGLLVLWLQRWHAGWPTVVGFPPRPRVLPELGAGILRGVVLFIVITFAIGFGLTAVFTALTGHAISPPEQLPAGLDLVGKALAVAYAVVVAPISEEFFFRGCLFRSLRDRYGFGVGAVGSAVAFGLVHYVPAPLADSLLLMTVMVFTGLGLAWIYDRRGTIVPSMGAHMTFNAIALVLIFAAR
jgi:uncharacterized protein